MKKICFAFNFVITIFVCVVTNVCAEDCNTMIEKWFADEVETFSLEKNAYSEVTNTVEQYFNIRKKSLFEESSINVDFIGNNALEIENTRRLKIVKMQEKMNINITNAANYVDIYSVIQEENQYCITAYEWVFYDYDDLDVDGYTVNVSGFGVEHTLIVDSNLCIISDLYDESDLTGIKTVEEEIQNQYSDSDVELMEYDQEIELMSTMYSGYNPDAAANYADTYALNYNTDYYNFNSVGGDCANFTSQSIYAGGMPQVVGTAYGKDGWYYKSSSDRSATWTGASSLRTWMANNRGTLVNDPGASQIYKGSPVFYDWYNDGSWDHATICVGTNSEGTPIINSHNSDRYHVKWNYGYSSTRYSTVQLTNGNFIDTEAPTISNLSAEDISSDSFTIKCDLNDNVGVTRVWLNVWGPGGSNGYNVSASNGSFSHTINTSDYGGAGLYSVHVYAFDSVGNSIASNLSDINAVSDMENPVICNLYTSNISSDSFTINCEVYDNIAVTRAWIIVWGPGGNSGNGFSLSVYNNFSHTINTSDYGGRGTYTVHVYVYDANGNGTVAALNDINAVTDAEAPVICEIRPTNVSSSSFTINGEMYDDVGVTRVWLNIYGPSGSNGYTVDTSNNSFSHTINTSDYGGSGYYSIHVYAWDADGNSASGTLSDFYVGNDYSAPIITNLSVSGISDSTFTVNCSADEKIVRAWIYIMGPNKTEGYAVHLYSDSFMHTINTSDYGGAGTYEVHVYVWDTAGNEGGGCSTGKFVANKRHTVNFNANQGITSLSSMIVTYGAVYGTLPVSSRTGYTFKGWYTSAEGGTQITSDTVVTITETQTLYAQWEKLLPYTQSTVTQNGTSHTIKTTLNNISESCEVIVAAYKNKKFVTMQNATYSGSEMSFTIDGDIDEIKVMAWSDLDNARPVCGAEEIPQSDWTAE